MTKITAVGPRGDCPRFLAFLNRITGGDAALVSYLQRVLGYALTGVTREHALFFAYGTGANGKSVLLSTVAGILGEYHRTAPIETFVASNGDRHPTDLAGLRGARLVTATETEEGRRWAEARIKQLTGGDTVSARFMRQDFFEYRPAFKLVIAGNHKPSLRSVDEAIRRRFHMIPFAVTIPADERDVELVEKLKAEWPGILAWLIEGCLEWQAEDLRPPQAVLEATDAYLSAEDAIAAWIDDRCERDPSAWTSSSDLFTSWKAWADASGEQAGSMKRLTQTLETRSFHRHKMNRGQGFYGLCVKPDEASPLSWETRK
jgi:putative DNA primase/helicase